LTKEIKIIFRVEFWYHFFFGAVFLPAGFLGTTFLVGFLGAAFFLPPPSIVGDVAPHPHISFVDLIYNINADIKFEINEICIEISLFTMDHIFKNEYLSHPEWWFAKNDEIDDLLAQKFGYLLDKIVFNDDLLAVLVWDQLARHFYRTEYAHHIILYFLQKAIDIVRKNMDIVFLQNLTNCEFTFFLMPLRHGGCVKDVMRVLELSWQRLHKCENESDKDGVIHIKRFLTATYQRMDVKCQRDLLKKYKVSEVEELNVAEIKSRDIGKFESCNLKSGRFILSLSGGVDSMVCSWMLRKMFNQTKIVAVMIDYGNRQTCDAEVSFVTNWCTKLGITLYVRHIQEINRPTCMKFGMREIYETYTRNVRYECYKSVWDLEFGPVGECKYIYDDIPTVIMGHNKNDTFENIMTNMTMRNHWNNLYGMSESCIVDNIRFFRPSLSVWKDDIIDYASENNIPHLPCSTPKWSQRGRIRNEVIPVLNNWNKQCVEGFFEMADMLNGLHDLMLEKVNDICECLSLSYKGDVCMVGFSENSKIKAREIVNIRTNKLFIWQNVFLRLFGSKVIISQKSLKNFIEVCEKWINYDVKRQKVMLTKNVCFLL